MATTLQIGNVNKASDLSSQNADFLPQMWKKGVEVGEFEENFFSEFEGTSPDSPILKETDFAKGAGQTLTFRQMAGLYGDGKQGDEAVSGDAEAWRVGAYSVTVDYFRHATEHNLRTEDQTGLEEEINAGVPVELGKWKGRKKTRQIMMMFRHKGQTANIIYANNKASREALKTADVISMDGITAWGQALKTSGARPALVGRVGQNRIKRFILVATGEGLVSLKNASDYKQALRDGGNRGDGNYIFSGGFADVNGHVIREFNPEDHDGYGPVGSPFNPRARLGTAIAAGTTAIDITGGGSATAGAITTAKYFEDFSNYQYRFTPTDLVAADTTDRYVLIYNVSGADAGKWGFYRYRTNDGNKLTLHSAASRLAAASSGVAATTVGNVTWSGSVNTDAHPSDSIVIETNSYGVPFGRSLMLGSRAAIRGYGRFQNKRSFEALDGDFFKRTYVTSIFGQAPCQRADGKMPHYRIVEHAISYAGLNLPTVV